MNQPTGLRGTVARFDLGTNSQLDTTNSGYFFYYDEAGNVFLIVDKTGAVTDQFEQPSRMGRPIAFRTIDGPIIIDPSYMT